jgi:hypothetical protein
VLALAPHLVGQGDGVAQKVFVLGAGLHGGVSMVEMGNYRGCTRLLVPQAIYRS